MLLSKPMSAHPCCFFPTLPPVTCGLDAGFRPCPGGETNAFAISPPPPFSFSFWVLVFRLAAGTRYLGYLSRNYGKLVRELTSAHSRAV